MTNEQLYLVIGAPMLFNAVLIGLLVAYINAKIDAVSSRIDGVSSRIDGINYRIDGVESRLDAVNDRIDSFRAEFNQRFDDMRDLWRAELRRVEEVLDARLKHLEER